MPARHAVAMQILDPGEPAARARERLAAALADATVSAPDDAGLFTVELATASGDEALQRVWDAVAAAGADDHVAFAEHPDLPEHWRHRAAGPRA